MAVNNYSTNRAFSTKWYKSAGIRLDAITNYINNILQLLYSILLKIQTYYFFLFPLSTNLLYILERIAMPLYLIGYANFLILCYK